jgi:hypothetical protein
VAVRLRTAAYGRACDTHRRGVGARNPSANAGKSAAFRTCARHAAARLLSATKRRYVYAPSSRVAVRVDAASGAPRAAGPDPAAACTRRADDVAHQECG